jgi:hypothetical protein
MNKRDESFSGVEGAALTAISVVALTIATVISLSLDVVPAEGFGEPASEVAAR